MSIADKTILITGASRGIGRALVDEALRRGAERVYAAARRPAAHPDERVTPLTLDVTDAAQVHAAAERVGSLDILINNAGLALYEGLGDRATLERHLAVNLFGTYAMSEAFLPALMSSGGAIVNNLSLNSLAPLPKASPESVARAIFDAVDRGEEDIFPDPVAQSLADGWRNGAVKAFERQLAELG
jgi:NAD(P)-dependent dehydrogenase (short-subunit alcohol dehydrogenase family)